MTVVEYIGGSAGSSLAMIWAKKVYKAHFISSNGFAKEKLQAMKAFGASVEIIHAENGILTAFLIKRMITRAKKLIQDPNTLWPEQINNMENKLGYHKMTQAIIEEIGTGKLHCLPRLMWGTV